MCLTAKDRIILIAEKDILVYKTVFDKHGEWTGIFFNNRYKYNTVVRAERFILFGGNKRIKHLCFSYYDSVNEGFHAYRIKKKHFYMRDYTEMKRAIIPKGSEYVIGNENDIVSSDIIVFRTNKDYVKYRINKFFNIFKTNKNE